MWQCPGQSQGFNLCPKAAPDSGVQRQLHLPEPAQSQYAQTEKRSNSSGALKQERAGEKGS